MYIFPFGTSTKYNAGALIPNDLHLPIVRASIKIRCRVSLASRSEANTGDGRRMDRYWLRVSDNVYRGLRWQVGFCFSDYVHKH